MYFKKTTIFFILLVFIAISEGAVRRKTHKTRKVRKGDIPKALASLCDCQKPLLDIVNCGCRGPTIDSSLGTLAPIEITVPISQRPVISDHRQAEIIEFNPLRGLFPSIEIPNYGILPAPMTTPNVEYLAALDLPCGCSIPQCGCRSPPVNLPPYQEYVAALELPSDGFQYLQIASVPTYSYGTTVIEIPSYAPAPVIQVPSGCHGSTGSPCRCCQGSSLEIPIPSCGCQEPCSCAEFQIVSCGCQSPCSCSGIPISSCGCSGPCGCAGIPKTCGCQESCGCPGIQATVGLLPSIDISSCSCQGPCGCRGPSECQGSCGCQGPCGCLNQKASGLLPAIEVPVCGCGCNMPGCNCQQYLRQVTMQPPFL